MLSRALPRLTTIGIYQINLDGKSISYTLKRSSRARYLRLEIRPVGLVVIIPRKVSQHQADTFIRSKESWILAKLARYQNQPVPPPEKSLESGDLLPYLGRQLTLKVHHEPHKSALVLVEGNNLLVNLNHATGNIESIVADWYHFQARILVTEKCAAVSKLMGISSHTITIRGQRTRWGSCSRKGTLSFNWKLLKTPEQVIDYVIIHELAHIKEMNHSRKFWNLVAKFCPEYKTYRKWLREQDALLT